MSSIKESTGICEIIIDKTFAIPGISGVLLRFRDKCSKKKYEAVLQAYKFVEERMVGSDSKELFYGICLVPNGMKDEQDRENEREKKIKNGSRFMTDTFCKYFG